MGGGCARAPRLAVFLVCQHRDADRLPPFTRGGGDEQRMVQMSEVSRRDLDAKMRAALQGGTMKTTKEFARVVGVSKDRADSSLARVTRWGREKKK